ncbi:related to hexose transporter protein [Serendipita indica DSM 11827]|uniref:Related to hexose transporter protein n=1 Tax=Serendipita indica (strain DSM 11827) TaxID=1109443 RepID=G4TDS4_SERID|nr:related to hexose transporter protein [Serendipita indica DSM 11827]
MAPNTGIASAGGRSLDPAMLHTGKWWKHSYIVKLNLLLVIPLITSYANGFDGSMMNGLQSVERWKAYFHYPKEEDLGLFNAIQSIGAFCAIPIAPYVSDGLGRRNGIAVGAFIVLIGAILQTATQNLGMFVGSRFLIGFGTTFAQMASPLLISEIAYPTHRAPLTSLYNTLWFSGSIVAAWTTFGTFRINSDWSWRIPSALQGLSSVIQLIFVWFLPESPRWLINRGRDEEAKAILARYHADGDASHPLIAFEYNEIKEAIALEAEAARVSWLDLFRTPGNRRRMRIILGIGVFSQWSGNGLISYYLGKLLDGIGITSSNDQTLVNGILAIYNFIIAISASMTVEKVGRRPLFVISTAGMLVSYAIIAAMSATYEKTQNSAAGRALLAFVFVFNGFYAIAYTPLLVSYTIEILPFLIRAKGLAAMNFSVMGAIIFNQYTNPIAYSALKWKYYLVYTIWLMFELVYVWLWATETKGRSLEETAALFDGEDAVAELSNRTGQDMTQVKHTGSDSQDEKLNIEHSHREVA